MDKVYLVFFSNSIEKDEILQGVFSTVEKAVQFIFECDENFNEQSWCVNEDGTETLEFSTPMGTHMQYTAYAIVTEKIIQ